MQHGNRMDLTGMRFGEIEVLEFVGNTKKNHAVYKVRSRSKGVYNELAMNLINKNRR
jgi:hypothetical protein